jgi:YD repeat-containing protein
LTLCLILPLVLLTGTAVAQSSNGVGVARPRPAAASGARTAGKSASARANAAVLNRAVGINESLLTTEAGPVIATYTGEVRTSFTDLSIRGRGLDFALVRHCHSLILYFGPFGRNMDSPLFARLRDLPSGDVDLYPGDGTRHTFRFNASEKRLVAPKGIFLDLYRRPDGSFFLVYPDQTRIFFDADGRMTRLVDRNTTREDSSDGNAMNFFYDGAGRLAVVQDPTNRRITLSYYPDDASRGVNGAFPGLVSRVTDFDQRAVDYSYDADGRLVKVEGPEPGSSSSKKPKTTLAWTPLPAGSDLKNLLYRSGELRSITDGEDRQIFQVGYEPAGTASQIAFADGTWRFAWSGSTTAITDPLGNLTTYSHDEAGHAVAIVQPGGATTAYEYDDEGRLTAETRPMGGLIEYTYASAAGNSKLPMGNLIRIAESPRPGSPEASVGHTRVTTIAYGPTNLPTALMTPDGAIVTVERDLRGNPISVRDGSGLTTSLSFNERGQVTATSDSRGNSTAHDYFGDGDGPGSGYQKSRTANGAATLYETDGRGNVVAVTDAAARRVTYSVNALDFVEGEASPTGQKRYQYDASGNMTTSSAQSGVGADSQPVFVSESFSYDALHAVTSVAVPTGTTTYQYDSAHNLATVGLPDGKTVSYAYDSRNRIAARTAGGKTERYGYDLENNRTTVTSPNGKVTAYLFDGFGRLNGTTDPSGLTTVSLLDRAGRPAEAKVAGPGNKLYRWSVRDYDALGRVRSEMAKVFSAPIALNADGTLPPGAQVQDAVTTWTYDAFGNVLTRRDALGRTATSQYDAAGRLTKMADPAGNTIEYTYDAAGNRTKVRETDVRTDDGTTANFETTTEFDAENRAKKVTDTLGQSRSFTYDPRGNLLTETDADGNVTAYKYDEAGRRIEIDRPEGIVTKFVYDGNGNVTKAIDAQDKETRYGYDARNRVATITYPDGKSLTYGHDDDGNVVSQGESGGTAINFTTDNNGRPTARSFTRGPGVEGPSSETFTYDPLGRLVSADNGQAKVELNYDSLDRVTSEKLTTGGVSYTVTSAIDLAGNATGVTYPSGRSLVRIFDALDRLSSIQDGSSAIATYAYAGRERLARKTFGNGVSETVAYDGARRPVGITAGSSLLDHRYGWTNTNRKAFTTLTGGKSDVYGYDRALRLVSEKLAVPWRPPSRRTWRRRSATTRSTD